MTERTPERLRDILSSGGMVVALMGRGRGTAAVGADGICAVELISPLFVGLAVVDHVPQPAGEQLFPGRLQHLGDGRVAG